MNPNDIIAHYAAERLSLLMQFEQAKSTSSSSKLS